VGDLNSSSVIVGLIASCSSGDGGGGGAKQVNQKLTLPGASSLSGGNDRQLFPTTLSTRQRHKTSVYRRDT